MNLKPLALNREGNRMVDFSIPTEFSWSSRTAQAKWTQSISPGSLIARRCETESGVDLGYFLDPSVDAIVVNVE